MKEERMTTTALIANSLPIPSALGSLDAYISAVHQIPVLSVENERELANRYREDEDLDAARERVSYVPGSERTPEAQLARRFHQRQFALHPAPPNFQVPPESPSVVWANLAPALRTNWRHSVAVISPSCSIVSAIFSKSSY